MSANPSIRGLAAEICRHTLAAAPACALLTLTFAVLAGLVGACMAMVGTPEALAMAALSIIALAFVSPAACAFAACRTAIGQKPALLPSAVISNQDFWKFAVSAVATWWLAFVPAATLGVVGLMLSRTGVGALAFMGLIVAALGSIAWILTANARLAAACGSAALGKGFGPVSAWKRTSRQGFRLVVVFVVTAGLPLAAAARFLGAVSPSAGEAGMSLPSIPVLVGYLVVRTVAYVVWGAYCGVAYKAFAQPLEAAEAHAAAMPPEEALA